MSSVRSQRVFAETKRYHHLSVQQGQIGYGSTHAIVNFLVRTFPSEDTFKAYIGYEGTPASPNQEICTFGITLYKKPIVRHRWMVKKLLKHGIVGRHDHIPHDFIHHLQRTKEYYAT